MTRLLAAVLLVTASLSSVNGTIPPKDGHDGDLIRLAVPALPTSSTGTGEREAPVPVEARSSAAPSRTVAPRKAARTRAVESLSGQHLNWTALARCESGGDPRAISPTGKFRGLVQFSLASWHAVGMTGDPIDYPASVQIAAAVRLLRLQGRGAWPECGRFL